MGEHFNQLTPAEAERLAMLAEEAGEIVQAVTKILRHGYASHHPDDPSYTPNSALLRRELTDLEAVREMMVVAGDIVAVDAGEVFATMERKRRYTHHQIEAD